MKLRRWHIFSSLILVLAVALTLGVGIVRTHSTHAAAHTVILHYGSFYQYKVVPTGADQGFQDPSYVARGFKSGQAAFGTGSGCPLDSTIKTPWSPITDILLRKEINLPAGTTGLTVHVAIDNDVAVYWNGTQIGTTTHDGCAARNSLVAPIPDTAILTGNNLLAVRGTDRGGETYLDLQILQG